MRWHATRVTIGLAIPSPYQRASQELVLARLRALPCCRTHGRARRCGAFPPHGRDGRRGARARTQRRVSTSRGGGRRCACPGARADSLYASPARLRRLRCRLELTTPAAPRAPRRGRVRSGGASPPPRRERYRGRRGDGVRARTSGAPSGPARRTGCRRRAVRGLLPADAAGSQRGARGAHSRPGVRCSSRRAISRALARSHSEPSPTPRHARCAYAH